MRRRIKRILKKIEYVGLGLTIAGVMYLALVASSLNGIIKEDKLNNIKY